MKLFFTALTCLVLGAGGAWLALSHKQPPPPPKDFTALKRDLLELKQATAISKYCGLVGPAHFIECRNTLANDYRLQRNLARNTAAELAVKDTLELSDKLFRDSNNYKFRGGLYSQAATTLSQLDLNIDVAIALLEREEQSPQPTPGPGG